LSNLSRTLAKPSLYRFRHCNSGTQSELGLDVLHSKAHPALQWIFSSALHKASSPLLRSLDQGSLLRSTVIYFCLVVLLLVVLLLVVVLLMG
jgi:hypothetical protein